MRLDESREIEATLKVIIASEHRLEPRALLHYGF